MIDIRNDFFFRLRRGIQHAMSRSSRIFPRHFHPGHFEVVRLGIEIPGLPSNFDGYRIVHISDIHYGQWISADRIAGAAGIINRQRPDMVAITGDFVSYSGEEIGGMSAGLKALQAKDGVVAVLGNHDYWVDAAKVRSVLCRNSVRELNNDVYGVTRAGGKLYFAGIGSVMLKKHRIDDVLNNLPADGPAVLLAHEPFFADAAAGTKRFSLQLSGHSHGGQCIVPGLGSPFLGGRHRKYCAGKYRVGDMMLYTNRGLGTNSFWVRINCPPEITVIDLRVPRTARLEKVTAAV